MLWYGIPQELASTFAKLVAARKLYLHPAPVAHLRPEMAPGELPLLDRLPADRAGRPMWLPVVLGDIAPEGGVGRLGRIARMALNRCSLPLRSLGLLDLLPELSQAGDIDDVGRVFQQPVDVGERLLITTGAE